MAGLDPASAGQLATARSSSPCRSHTSARTAPVASTTRTTVNYRLGSASSADASFFLAGNAVMRGMYGETYPWRQPREARLGPAAHARG